jgi:uncharacterized membrane protein YphA (DoxX/SURF4 family)
MKIICLTLLAVFAIITFGAFREVLTLAHHVLGDDFWPAIAIIAVPTLLYMLRKGYFWFDAWRTGYLRFRIHPRWLGTGGE